MAPLRVLAGQLGRLSVLVVEVVRVIRLPVHTRRYGQELVKEGQNRLG